jgi:hypothetical protein
LFLKQTQKSSKERILFLKIMRSLIVFFPLSRKEKRIASYSVDFKIAKWQELAKKKRTN